MLKRFVRELAKNINREFLKSKQKYFYVNKLFLFFKIKNKNPKKKN